MLRILIYKGWGMYDRDGIILLRQLTKHVSSQKYSISFISPEEIVAGTLNHETSLFVIGGGFDLGLIQGQVGMKKIKEYVNSGGSYLGICSGAYFACDYIEFDKNGPLEVIGERFLKFYPGHSYGPIYKKYDYKTRSGAVGSSITYSHEQLVEGDERDTVIGQCVKGLHSNLTNGLATEAHSDSDQQFGDLFDTIGISRSFMTYFNGGGLFVSKDDNLTVIEGKITPSGNKNKSDSETNMNGNQIISNDDRTKNYDHFESPDNEKHNVEPEITCDALRRQLGYDSATVLARYTDLDMNPAAIVKCHIGKGTAVLSHVHFEYDADDINDGDVLVKDIVDKLKVSENNRKCLFLSILKELNISLDESLLSSLIKYKL